MSDVSGQQDEQKQDEVRRPVEQIETARIQPARNAALFSERLGARVINESRSNSNQ